MKKKGVIGRTRTAGSDTNGMLLCRTRRKRDTDAAPSMASAIRRRKNGHRTALDRSYMPSRAAWKSSIIVADDDDVVVVVVVVAASSSPPVLAPFLPPPGHSRECRRRRRSRSRRRRRLRDIRLGSGGPRSPPVPNDARETSRRCAPGAGGGGKGTRMPTLPPTTLMSTSAGGGGRRRRWRSRRNIKYTHRST